MAIPATIYEKNASRPFDRVLLAKALGTTPASSGFTMKLNSSAKYGLTEGGYNDETIALTALGDSIVAAGDDAERHQVMLAAAIRPELFHRFYEMLDGKRLPDDSYARDILQRELDVDASLTQECLRIIKHNGLLAGLLGDVGGSLYVSLAGSHGQQPSDGQAVATRVDGEAAAGGPEATPPGPESQAGPGMVFIGHAGNSDVVDFLKRVLDSFDIPYRVVETDFDSNRPIAPGVSQEMRACDAGILVFASPADPEWTGRREEKRMEKMLYQLGAASALYGDRIVSVHETDTPGQSQAAAFDAIVFQRDQLDQLGLPLLSELHRRGVIEVRAAGRAH